MEEESSFLNPARTLALANVREGMTIADFGASGGFFTRAAARLADGGVVWAVDTNGDLLSRIKSLSLSEGLTNVEVLRGNIEAPGGSGLPAEHFDLVIAANILFSAHHKDKVIQEIRRVLKRVGRAIVIDWSSSHGGLGPHPDHVIGMDDARKLFEDNGFEFAQSIPAGAYHWGFIVRKSLAKGAQ